MQIYNLNDVIQENQLQYLQLATDFAKFAANNSNDASSTAPFQDLLFLLRDWINDEDHEFGLDGGKEYLNRYLSVKDGQDPDLRSVREFIRSSFENLDCFLMPSPGKKVVNGRQYDGKWSEMEDDFKSNLMELISWFFGPSHLKVKKIDGYPITAQELKEYMEAYFKIFQSPLTPRGQSVYQITVEKQMNILIENCLKTYKLQMAKNNDYANPNFVQNLDSAHTLCKIFSLLEFKNLRKMGNTDDEKIYSGKLEQQINQQFESLKDDAIHNLEKFMTEQKKTQDAIKEKERIQAQALKDLEKTQGKIQKLEQDRDSMSQEVYKTKQELLQKTKSFQEMAVKNNQLSQQLQTSLSDAVALQRSMAQKQSQFENRMNTIQQNHQNALQSQKAANDRLTARFNELNEKQKRG